MKNEQLLQMAELVKRKYSALIQQGANENGLINKLIVAEYQEATGAQDFKTFKDWKEEGLIVKKGEKGFPVFSKPIKGKKDEKQPQDQEKEKKGPVYFATAYLFNETQVEQMGERPKEQDPQTTANIERMKQLATINHK